MPHPPSLRHGPRCFAIHPIGCPVKNTGQAGGHHSATNVAYRPIPEKTGYKLAACLRQYRSYR